MKPRMSVRIATSLLVLLPVFAVVAVVVFFLIAITREDVGDRDVWFAAIGAGIALGFLRFDGHPPSGA